MARRTRHDDSLARLRASLRGARDDGARLQRYLAFLRAPGTASTNVQLSEANTALLLKKLTAYPLAAAELHLLRARIRAEAGSYDTALVDLVDAHRYCEDNVSVGAAHLMIRLARQYDEMCRPNDAIDAYRKAVHRCDMSTPAPGTADERNGEEEQEEWLLLRADAYAGEGDCWLVLQSVREALEAHQRALALREVTGRTDLVAVSLAALARVHLEIGDSRKAQEYLARGLDAARACEHCGAMAGPVAQVHEQLAEVHLALRRPDDARKCLWRASILYDDLNDNSGIARTHIIAGRICESESQITQAKEEYAKAYDILDRYGIRRLVPAALLAAGSVHRRHAPAGQARFLLLDALREATAMHDRRMQRRVHMELSETYCLMERWPEALEHFQQATAIARELSDEQHRRALAHLQAEFDAAEAAHTRERLQAATREAARNRQELKVSALQLSEHTQVLRKMATALDGALKHLDDRRPARARERLAAMQGEVRNALNAREEYWQQLHKRVTPLDEDFMSCLKEKHKTLTKAELEICALVRLGFSADEIASARSGGRATIYTHRRNISRKLSLKSSNDLEDYLRAIRT